MLQAEVVTKCYRIDQRISPRHFPEEEALDHIPCMTLSLSSVYASQGLCYSLAPNCHHVGPTHPFFCIFTLVSKDEGNLLSLNLSLGFWPSKNSSRIPGKKLLFHN